VGDAALDDLRRARADEAGAIRDLIARSMAHWPHSPEYLKQAIDLMSLSGEDLQRDEAWVVTRDGAMIGFYRISLDGDRAEIEELHLDPAFIGRGLGRRLFEHAVERARAVGATVLEWSTDQYALGFYRAMGGRTVGTSPSGIAGDPPLTRMLLDLD
jgi:ribosomal protein S18 acetylase RimI-like enzyme